MENDPPQIALEKGSGLNRIAQYQTIESGRFALWHWNTPNLGMNC